MITDKQRAHKVCKVIRSCNSTQLAAIGDWVVKQVKRIPGTFEGAEVIHRICICWDIQMNVVAQKEATPQHSLVGHGKRRT